MVRKTIIFINKFPLSSVYAESIDFERYIKASYQLIYLDMSRIFFPDTYKHYASGNERYVFHKDFFIECRTKEEVTIYIKAFSESAWFFVLHHSYARDTSDWWLFRAFKKYHCEYILWGSFSVPEGANKPVRLRTYLLERAIKILSSCDLEKLFRRIYNWVFMFLIGRDLVVRKPAFCFAAGAVGINRFKTLYPKSKVVSIPNVNYYKNRLVISGLNNERNDIPKYRYVLYIDQSIFDSPDRKIVSEYTIDREHFFERINNWFNRIEEITGKQVVIAASPKYSYKGDEYNGRQIINHRTIELVYSADMVVVHSSSAVDFAVLSYKPVIFLKVNGFSDAIVTSIERAAGGLYKIVLDSEEDLDTEKLNKVSGVDKDIYDQYIKDYLITRAFTESPSEIIVKRIGKE